MAEYNEGSPGLHELDVDDVDHQNDHYADDDKQEHSDIEYKTKAIAVSTNKALTSKFRGVCWNKKNKRWQAAINSSGKYLYLGSYDTQEEAAKVFDRAAVRVRGPKARINFRYNDYVDASGNVLPDAQVEALLLEATNPTKPRRQRAKTKTKDDADPQPSSAGQPGGQDKVSAEIALKALARLCGPQDLHQAQPDTSALAGNGHDHSLQLTLAQLGQQHQGQHLQPSSAVLLQQQLNMAAAQPLHEQQRQQQVQQLLQQSLRGGNVRAMHAPDASATQPQAGNGGTRSLFSIVQSHLPEGASLDSILPSDDGKEDACGVLYSFANSDKTGAAVWNGRFLHSLGLYGSDKDAKQACLGALQLCHIMQGPHDQATAASTSQPQPSSSPLAGGSAPAAGINSNFTTAWGLPGALGKLPELFKPAQQLLAVPGPSRPIAEPLGLHFPGLKVDSLGLLQQHTNGNQVFELTGLQQVTGVSPGMGGWQLNISQPDPALCNGSSTSTGTQEITDESVACGTRRPWQEGDAMGDAKRQRTAGPAVSLEFAALRQLAGIDVQEALKLFFAAKQGAQG